MPHITSIFLLHMQHKVGHVITTTSYHKCGNQHVCSRLKQPRVWKLIAPNLLHILNRYVFLTGYSRTHIWTEGNLVGFDRTKTFLLNMETKALLVHSLHGNHHASVAICHQDEWLWGSVFPWPSLLALSLSHSLSLPLSLSPSCWS